MNSDVNVSTGNVKYRGDVIINGTVREGFSIISGGSVTINGACEGAKILAEGDVTISEGFTGMTEGSIYSGGNIKCRYMQNVIAKCAGTIETEYAIHSVLMAQNEIIATSGRGTIAGGEIYTCGKITTKNLGADTYVATKVVIDHMPNRFWDSNFNPRIQTMVIEELDPLEEDMMIPAKENPVIEARDCAYPGVRIQLGMRFYEVENELKCTKFHLENNDISASPIF